jgi:hypothetical protein
MTNSSPQNPQDSQNPQEAINSRRRSGIPVDETIALIVAFGTIGTILFWSLGNRKGEFTNTFRGQNGLLSLSSKKATETGTTQSKLSATDKGDSDSLKLGSRLREQESPTIVVPAESQGVNISPEVKQKSFTLDSGAKLIPLTGIATIPAIKADPEIPQAANPKKVDAPPKTEPKAATPGETQTPIKSEPEATKPEKVEIPGDVTPSYWAYPFVKQMGDKALVPELADDQAFEPELLITRAGMATLISQAFEQKPVTEKIKKFTDVSNQNAIAVDIDKAVKTGFMQGYSDNEFRPLENIPRYQVLVTLATGLGLKPSQDASQILQKFDDGTNIPDWAKEQVAAATEAGLVVNRPGFSSNSLKPNESATRAEVAAMIHQALVNNGKLKPLESQYIVKP